MVVETTSGSVERAAGANSFKYENYIKFPITTLVELRVVLVGTVEIKVPQACPFERCNTKLRLQCNRKCNSGCGTSCRERPFQSSRVCFHFFQIIQHWASCCIGACEVDDRATQKRRHEGRPEVCMKSSLLLSETMEVVTAI